MLNTRLLTHGFSNYSFFVVGNDAANKIRVGVPQCGHELSEWLLVELAHSPKHALFRFVGGTKSRLIHPCHLVEAHNTVNWWREGENWLEQGLHGEHEGATGTAEATMWSHELMQMDEKRHTLVSNKAVQTKSRTTRWRWNTKLIYS